jgi:hypothetical protein
MRSAFEVGLLLGVVGLSAIFAASGCEYSCDPDFGLANCPAASSSSTGGINGKCDPTVNLDTAVDDSCGVFVRLTGSDTNPGTKGMPVLTKSLPRCPRWTFLRGW